MKKKKQIYIRGLKNWCMGKKKKKQKTFGVFKINRKKIAFDADVMCDIAYIIVTPC